MALAEMRALDTIMSWLPAAWSGGFASGNVRRRVGSSGGSWTNVDESKLDVQIHAWLANIERG